MIVDEDNLQVKEAERPRPLRTSLYKCAGFRELKNWQVDQYRQAVDENRWYMAEKLGRPVDWSEAEYDFCKHGYYGCAEKWRKEYCGEICPVRKNCLLALRMMKESELPEWSKTA